MSRYLSVAGGLAWRLLHTLITNPLLFLPPMLMPLFFFTAFAGGLSAVVMSTRDTLTGALAGMEAIGNHPEATPGLYLLLRGLYAPTTWTEAAVGFAVMATTGLLVGAITAKPISSLARARS